MSNFADQVRNVLSDTMNLPADFLSMIPQYVAQNPVAVARTSGDRIAFGSQTSAISTTNTTFGTGATVLPSDLVFTADGKTDYVFRVWSANWNNSGGVNLLGLKLDGAQYGILSTSSASTSLAAVGLIQKPASGSHTVNAVLYVTAGTGAIEANATGPGSGYVPILSTIEVA